MLVLRMIRMYVCMYVCMYARISKVCPMAPPELCTYESFTTFDTRYGYILLFYLHLNRASSKKKKKKKKKKKNLPQINHHENLVLVEKKKSYSNGLVI